MKKTNLIALLSLISAAMPLSAFVSINYSSIYIKNNTGKDLVVGERHYIKQGFKGSEKSAKSEPSFIIKPGKRAKVAILDRDQAGYPDEVTAQGTRKGTNIKYRNKNALVYFSINNESTYYFTSQWPRTDTTQKFDLTPLSSEIVVSQSAFDSGGREAFRSDRNLPIIENGIQIFSYYVFPKLYHDIEILVDPKIKP